MVVLEFWLTKGKGFGILCNMDKNSRKIILSHDDMVRSTL